MAATAEFSCKWCERIFIARTADRDRGWAQCCHKSCAASYREFGVSKAVANERHPLGKRKPNIVRYAERLGVIAGPPSKKKGRKPPRWIRGVLSGALFKPNNRDQYEDVDHGHPHASGFDGHGQD